MFENEFSGMSTICATAPPAGTLPRSKTDSAQRASSPWLRKLVSIRLPSRMPRAMAVSVPVAAQGPRAPGVIVAEATVKSFPLAVEALGNAVANEAIEIQWDKEIPAFLEGMVEYTAGVLKNKAGKALFVSFITDVSPACDCYPANDAPIVKNIGIAASLDPVAIDQASVDLINAEPALAGTRLQVKMQDRLWPATVTEDSPYDPENAAVRKDG